VQKLTLNSALQLYAVLLQLPDLRCNFLNAESLCNFLNFLSTLTRTQLLLRWLTVWASSTLSGVLGALFGWTSLNPPFIGILL